MNFHFRIYNNPVINPEVKIYHVPRVWRFASGESTAALRAARRRASPAAKRAFCHGIVKNQPRSATELLLFGSSENPALLNFPLYTLKSKR
jgi:hypothetical protein